MAIAANYNRGSDNAPNGMNVAWVHGAHHKLPLPVCRFNGKKTQRAAMANALSILQCNRFNCLQLYFTRGAAIQPISTNFLQPKLCGCHGFASLYWMRADDLYHLTQNALISLWISHSIQVLRSVLLRPGVMLKLIFANFAVRDIQRAIIRRLLYLFFLVWNGRYYTCSHFLTTLPSAHSNAWIYEIYNDESCCPFVEIPLTHWNDTRVHSLHTTFLSFYLHRSARAKIISYLHWRTYTMGSAKRTFVTTEPLSGAQTVFGTI